VQKGIIIKFSEKDLANLNKRSKDFIRNKIKRSRLMGIVKHQASDTISVIIQLIEPVGWNWFPGKYLWKKPNQNQKFYPYHLAKFSGTPIHLFYINIIMLYIISELRNLLRPDPYDYNRHSSATGKSI
jgi:hypothetical protein